jgi:hypothetical protein
LIRPTLIVRLRVRRRTGRWGGVLLRGRARWRREVRLLRWALLRSRTRLLDRARRRSKVWLLNRARRRRKMRRFGRALLRGRARLRDRTRRRLRARMRLFHGALHDRLLNRGHVGRHRLCHMR